jgi:hypothetical protein
MKDLCTPFCPHINNEYREDSHAQMVPVEQRRKGVKQWVFEAMHKCAFESV